VVGASPTELESANELIRCDHMYYKLIPETNTDPTESLNDMDECNILDNICTSPDTEDISSLTSLDMIDFEQLVDYPAMSMSCLQQDDDVQSSKETAPDNGCNSPFMQINDDEITVSFDTEVCSISSPSSGYASSLSSSSKSPFRDDIINAFLDLADDEHLAYSWQESFTLFPSLDL